MADQQHPRSRVSAVLWRWVPPPALTGFLVLLVAVFGVAYGVGSAVGPVAPGMRPGAVYDDGTPTERQDGGGMDDMHSGGGR
ncbi:hypothetical protein AB0O07_06310 [Streptomyces sp. NPDC093085]|uniref:hypothetical protein n=1 Tax=Streptomyces sp. NPDC093085 TaxID=3155068 RepID=UPI00342DC39A